MVEMAQQVFPPGLVQILGGDDKVGPALVVHPDIQKISFTGSIATGKKIQQSAAKTLKRVTLVSQYAPNSLRSNLLTSLSRKWVATTPQSSCQT
jgi:delta 1-pyrroline-5-carboxylate dehydrogenase